MNEECYRSVQSCYSTWSETYYDNYYGKKAAYPPVHRELLKSLLLEAGIETLLDAGCGPASFLRELIGSSIELYGFDITPEMVVEANKVLGENGLPSDRVWQGSVVDASSFQMRRGKDSQKFDAAICIGVFPHIQKTDDLVAIQNLRNSVRDGGLVAIEARNELFSLFTLNRYSYQFLVQNLIDPDSLSHGDDEKSQELRDSIDSLKQFFCMDLPPIRQGKKDEPGYDEVLSRLHNPITFKEQFAKAGFEDVQLLFYHYHCLPPMLESQMPEFFREQSLAMENPTDWRGYFMASAFIIVGRKTTA